jgi:hypothetical protein
VKTFHAVDGWADVLLAYEGNEIVFAERIEGKFWYSDASYNYPKWGLYRALDTIFNPIDSIDLQDVQIWIE